MATGFRIRLPVALYRPWFCPAPGPLLAARGTAIVQGFLKVSNFAQIRISAQS
jgi:hypothetical protein